MFKRILYYFKKLKHSTLKVSSQSLFGIGFIVLRNLLMFGILMMTLIVCLLVGTGLGYFANIISHTEIPSEQAMKAKIGSLNEASALLFNNGEMISEVQSDLTRKIVDSKDISDYVKKGLIATEDNLFYSHHGIVPKSSIRAVLQELLGATQQTGGSTITQQLVKQQLLSNEVTFSRKAKEILLALRLEKFFSKDAILTAYLNTSPFGRNNSGQNIAGIEAAAEGVFGKKAKDLTLPQAAFLVGLPQSPYYYTPYQQDGSKKDGVSSGIARMKVVLDAMKREGYISEEDWKQASAYPIEKDFLPTVSHTQSRQSFLYQAIHREAVITLMKQAIAADGKKWEDVNRSDAIDTYNDYYFKSESLLSSSGYKVYSTIDKNIYNNMQTAVAQHLNSLGPTYQTKYTDPKTGKELIATEPPQVGATVIENKTGKVLAFVGGSNFNISQADHAFSTRRSPGSTIKPLLVYAPAFENKIAYPASLLADFPISRKQADGSYWQPSNASGTISNTFMTARYALTMSLNNPTIHLYSSLLANGINPGKYMDKMGIDSIPQSEYLNEAAAVGGLSNGPTVAEQTSAFTTFVNNGNHIPYYLIEKIEDTDGKMIYQHQQTATPVFSEGTAYLIRSILKDSTDHGSTQYFKEYLNFKIKDVFGKTGTSDNYQDMWTIISTPKITIGQWIGWDNHYGEKHYMPKYNSFGPSWSRSQRFWSELANVVHAAKPDLFDSPDTFSKQPDSVVSGSVLKLTGTAPGEMNVSNGSKLSVTGEMMTDIVLKDRPPFPISYQFSPGATKEELAPFWDKLFKQSKTTPANPSQAPNNPSPFESSSPTNITSQPESANHP